MLKLPSYLRDREKKVGKCREQSLGQRRKEKLKKVRFKPSSGEGDRWGGREKEKFGRII